MLQMQFFLLNFSPFLAKKLGRNERWIFLFFSCLPISAKKGRGHQHKKKSREREVCVKNFPRRGKHHWRQRKTGEDGKQGFFSTFPSLAPENLLGFCEEETNKNSNINTFTYFLVPLHSHNSLREKITFKALTTFKSLLLRYDRDDDAVFAFGANLLSCHIDKEKSSTKIGERLKLLLYFSVTLIYSYMP